MSECCHGSPVFIQQTVDSPKSDATPQKWLRFAIALVVAGLSMQFSLGVNLSPVSGRTRLLIHGGLAIASILVLVLLGGPIFRRSWAAVKQGQITLEQLFLIAIAGAMAASVHSSFTGTGAIYYEVIGVLVAVYTLGQMLVERQRSKVRLSLQQLTDELRTAVRLTCCGKRRTVPVSELEPGDRVFVEKGQKLPVDGTIAEGSAYVQEISHTGEPFPAAKATGDPVLAGSVALDGDLIISVSAADSRELDRITVQLERALNRRSGWLREADRWMARFVPSVALLAACTFAFWMWRGTWEIALFNSLAVLLVACPCGLGLGVPLAFWHALHRMVRLGIVPDGSELVERLARVRTVIFDKTGTLTDGKLQIRALVTLGEIDAAALRARLALVESHCDHPVARPFSAQLGDLTRGSQERLEKLSTLPGQGVSARLSSPSGAIAEMTIGNSRLLSSQHQPALELLRQRLPADAGSYRELFVLQNGNLIAIAILSETARPAIASISPRLRALGLELGIMTGDSSPNAKLWTDNALSILSGMTSAEKAAAVYEKERSGERVLFVGDGLNDAEAMAIATASLAVVGGDSTARAQAHGELPGMAFDALPDAIAISRSTQSTIRLVLVASLTYNAAGIALAATGWLHPVAAAVIMFASSLTVVSLAGRAASHNCTADFAPASGS